MSKIVKPNATIQPKVDIENLVKEEITSAIYGPHETEELGEKWEHPYPPKMLKIDRTMLSPIVWIMGNFSRFATVWFGTTLIGWGDSKAYIKDGMNIVLLNDYELNAGPIKFTLEMGTIITVGKKFDAKPSHSIILAEDTYAQIDDLDGATGDHSGKHVDLQPGTYVRLNKCTYISFKLDRSVKTKQCVFEGELSTENMIGMVL